MHVKVAFRYLAGEHVVDEAESWIIAIEHFEIAGRWLSSEHATLCNQGPFLEFHVQEIDEDYPYIQKGNREVAELRESLTPDDWLEGTDEEVLRLPVSSIEWIDMNVLA
jgi:hypothetical protein